jgi:carbamoyltransferase
MSVLGANLGSTLGGKQLSDGGAALLSADGSPHVAIAEERLTRAKHQGGSVHSIDYCLRTTGTRRSDIELCVATSCCEPIRDHHSVSDFRDFGFSVDVMGHHEAHAYSAFWPSPFDEALVVVMDCGGNNLDSGSFDRWWTHSREQVTYYVGRGSDLEQIGRDFESPFALGFGEAFRAVTHFLGWPSSTFAGNTMALSALGDMTLRARPIWTTRSRRLRGAVELDNPLRPLSVVAAMFDAVGIKGVPPRHRDDPFSQAHQNVAQWLQLSFYDALRSSVSTLVARTGIRKVCFAGGVALNCVAIGQLLRDRVVDEVFVQPASGDTGQCLGAAYFGYRKLGGARAVSRLPFNAFLGREYEERDCKDALKSIYDSGTSATFFESPDGVAQVAKFLAAGKIVAWFTGQSEFGPRALGGRSIVADPRDIRVKERLTQIKDRAWFLPFAPSVLDSATSNYFEDGGSAHMTVAVPVLDAKRKQIRGVIHEDGTARVQRVPDDADEPFAELLREFGRVTGTPVLLNTSLNLRGQPIAETPRDAVDVFLYSDIDCLFLDGTVVVKDTNAVRSQTSRWAPGHETASGSILDDRP